MRKRDLVVRISRETGQPQQIVQNIVQRVFDQISEALAGAKKVELRNFGVFEVKLRKARIGRNPKSPKHDIRIPPRAIVKFKPGKEMGDAVLKLTAKKAKSEATAVAEPIKSQPGAAPPPA